MSSSVNPPVTASQPSVTGNQMSKTMYPQGTTTASFSQPAHVSQNLDNNMHTNTNIAHNHPNQQHHYSMNVSHTAGNFVNPNMGQIPASNHPVANASSTAAGQVCNLQKNVTSFMSNQNQNTLPPVSQTLHASVTSHPSANTANTAPENSEAQESDKPQSNGTPEVKSPPKTEAAFTFSLTPKEKNLQPAPVPQLPQVQENTQEKQAPAPIATQSSPIKTADAIDAKAARPIPVANSKPPASSPNTPSVETKETAKTTVNCTSSAHVESTENSTPSTPVETSVKESELKKPEVEEDSTSGKQLEIPETDKSSESDKEIKCVKDEPIKKQEPAVTNKEEPNTKSPEKTSFKEESPPKESNAPTTTPAPTPTTKTPARKVKPQTSKSDESPKPPKDQKVTVHKTPSVSKAKRQRTRTQPYQSPLPEVELISKITSITPRTPRSYDEKLIVFYKNEFLAVRNAEGSFYLCQAVQNIYKSSSKIKIRWLSQDKLDKTGEIYTPDFYDLTDFDCILTNLSLNRVEKGKFKLPQSEKERTQSILNRSLAVEKGEVTSPSLTEEHPDGLDLSLYRDEDQLKKRKAKKRKASQRPSSSSAKKEVSTKKSPEAAKVRKVTPVSKMPAKITSTKKPVQPVKKNTPQPQSRKTSSPASRASGRGRRKAETQNVSVMDQKKAKVLVKIGRKSAIPETKPVQSSSKNAKSGSKSDASSKKTTQTKTSLSVKSQPRSARKSTRK